MTISEEDLIFEVNLLDLTEKLRVEVGDIFKELRFESGWTQREASERIHTSQQNIPRLERGEQDLKLSTLCKYAYGYGYRVEINFIPVGDIHDED